MFILSKTNKTKQNKQKKRGPTAHRIGVAGSTFCRRLPDLRSDHFVHLMHMAPEQELRAQSMQPDCGIQIGFTATSHMEQASPLGPLAQSPSLSRITASPSQGCQRAVTGQSVRSHRTVSSALLNINEENVSFQTHSPERCRIYNKRSV